jgi:hypothetical protein
LCHLRTLPLLSVGREFRWVAPAGFISGLVPKARK